MLPIILASGSKYRQRLLSQLELEFNAFSADIDESPLPNEAPTTLVDRLARGKAAALSERFNNHLIIGSDQIGVIDNIVLTKPGNHQKAKEQLLYCSAKQVDFLTGICLLNSSSGGLQHCVEPITVHFRQLSEQQIDRYLIREKPYDCAGSFKVEGLGISLFEKVTGNDPNILVGLPLIKLVSMLNNEGHRIP